MLQRAFKTFTLLFTVAAASLVAGAPKPDTGIFANVLPESVPFYLSMNLYQFYSLSTYKLSEKSFPQDTIMTRGIVWLATNPDAYIAQASVPPTKVNTDLLSTHLGKMILHVRDPRDALVSMIEYTERQKNHPFILGLVTPLPPPEYFGWSYEKKVDWHIDRFYTNSLNWLEQWATFIQANPQLQVLVTSFEDMATRPLEFFREILSFYGTDPSLFNEKHVFPFTRDQFNADPSDIGIWRVKLTPAQQNRVKDLLKPELTKFYQWQN